MPLPHSSSETNAREKTVLANETSSQSVPVSPEERLLNEQSIRIKQWVIRRMADVSLFNICFDFNGELK